MSISKTTRHDQVPILAPFGGLVETLPPFASTFPNTGTPQCKNVIFDQGTIKRRPGLGTLRSGCVAEIHHTSEVQTYTGSFLNMYATATNIYYWNGAAWIDINPPATSMGGLLTVPPNSLMFSNRWLYTNGINMPICWDTSPAAWAYINTNPAAVPFQLTLKSARHMDSFGDRVFLGMTTEYDWTLAADVYCPQRLRWADMYGGYTGAQWISGSSGFVDLLDDPYYIVALKKYQDYLLVFKGSGVAGSLTGGCIYVCRRVGYPMYFSLSKIPGRFNCISKKSIQLLKDSLVFLGDDNIYVMSGSQPQPIGTEIYKKFLTRVNSSYIQYTTGAVDAANNLFYLFFIPSGTNAIWFKSFYVWNYQENTWTYGEIEPGALAGLTTIDPYWGNYRFQLGGYVSNPGASQILDYGSSYTQDLTSTISREWYSKVFVIEEGSTFYSLGIYGEGSMTISVGSGESLNNMKWSPEKIRDFSKDQNQYVDIGSSGKFFQVKITNNSSNNMVIKALMLYIGSRGGTYRK